VALLGCFVYISLNKEKLTMKKYKKNYSDKEILLDQALDELELTGTLDDIYHDVSGNNTLDDLDDYEYQQEQAYGIQSKNLQFIPTDRYIKRTRKG
tara:strand:- start:14464 stop:14751 length:288 start_codon:yes stop_codon:yes gene_type:complete